MTRPLFVLLVALTAAFPSQALSPDLLALRESMLAGYYAASPYSSMWYWADWYVDNTWTGETLGTLDAPFTNIQTAIVMAGASNFAANTINVRDTGIPYEGPLVFRNMNALRLRGYGGRPTIRYSGAVGAHTIMSGTNYNLASAYACMPPAQVGLENLRIENHTTASGEWYCADVQTWVTWEYKYTGMPERLRYGITNVIFDGAGRNSGVRLRDLDQGHMVPWGIPYANFHTSLVQGCVFARCKTGVRIMSMQCARVAYNWFISNDLGVTAVEMTNGPYKRAYDTIHVGYNVFAWCAQDGIRGGIYSNLVYYNNTFFACGGTGTLFNAGAFASYGKAGLYNNIFYANGAAWVADPADTNLLAAGHNMYWANAATTGWEAFGTPAYFTNPLFVSVDYGDPTLFLCPELNGPADVPGFGGATFLGARAPIPEPAAAVVACLLLLLPRRR
ncbi:MAG: hypothetical protein N2595_01225 [bacterium]|nr:hypothetical protein [bacterium]